jgi:hypothetical protein
MGKFSLDSNLTSSCTEHEAFANLSQKTSRRFRSTTPQEQFSFLCTSHRRELPSYSLWLYRSARIGGKFAWNDVRSLADRFSALSAKTATTLLALRLPFYHASSTLLLVFPRNVESAKMYSPVVLQIPRELLSLCLASTRCLSLSPLPFASFECKAVKPFPSTQPFRRSRSGATPPPSNPISRFIHRSSESAPSQGSHLQASPSAKRQQHISTTRPLRRLNWHPFVPSPSRLLRRRRRRGTSTTDKPIVMPPPQRSTAPQKPRKKATATAEKRATLREKKRLSKRAQRKRQVQQLAFLEEKVVEQAGEIEELKRKLSKSEGVVSMLMREVQIAKRKLGDGV